MVFEQTQQFDCFQQHIYSICVNNLISNSLIMNLNLYLILINNLINGVKNTSKVA